MAGLESYRRLDIRYFSKKNLLRPGYSFTFSWTRGTVRTGEIGIKVEPDCLILTYHYTRYEESEDVRERVYLDWTPCNYGGRRPWFLCPGCGRRVGILAAAGELFLCRYCYRLKYWSQLGSDRDRAQRKVKKLRDRLGEKEWLKPKGMHQKTFDRLHSRLVEAEMRSNEVFLRAAWARKLLMRIDLR
ncbi:MAG: hypothetical protein ACLP2X_10960 [Syntrophobacteraceae bacterium]